MFCLEYFFNIGVRQIADDENITEEEAKNLLQWEFVRKLGLRISFILQGKGTSNIGNDAKKFFDKSCITAEILNLDKDVLYDYGDLLNQLDSTTVCHSPELYETKAHSVFERIVQLYGGKKQQNLSN